MHFAVNVKGREEGERGRGGRDKKERKREKKLGLGVPLLSMLVYGRRGKKRNL